jgi:pullulanase
MGHQPRAVMERAAARRQCRRRAHINLIGEGWNFGEVADGARFVQASQLSLNGSGIGTFSDRARDAVRGGGAGDNDARLVTATRAGSTACSTTAMRRRTARAGPAGAADLVRVGLAGSLRDYRMQTSRRQRCPAWTRSTTPASPRATPASRARW